MTLCTCKKCKCILDSKDDDVFYCTTHKNIFCKGCGFIFSCNKSGRNCSLNEVVNDKRFIYFLQVKSEKSEGLDLYFKFKVYCE